MLSKADVLPEDERRAALDALSAAAGRPALSVSVADADALKAFSDALAQELAA